MDLSPKGSTGVAPLGIRNSLDRELNFTKAALQALPLPQTGKRVYYRDSKTRGLMFAITPNGARAFVFYRKIEGRPERILIGRFPDLSIEQARNKAAQLNAEIALGGNPADKRRLAREEMTFGELFEQYFDRHSKPCKRNWRDDLSKYELYLNSDKHGGIKLSPKRLSKITRADLAQLHSLISKKRPITANRVLAMVSGMFGWATRSGLWEKQNPASHISKNREISRDRYLQAEELPRFFEAVASEKNETFRDYVLISLFTGARQGNVVSMRWDQVNLEGGTWYIPETKNGTPQLVPLTERSIEILSARKAKSSPFSEFVFPGVGKTSHLTSPRYAWYRLLKRAGIRELRLHDLRRTLGSWQAATGASLPIIGKTLNHKHPASTAIYARLSLDPVRDALVIAHRAMLRVGGEHISGLTSVGPIST